MALGGFSRLIHLRAGRRASGTLGETSILKYATKILETYLPLDEPGLLTRHNAKRRPRDEPRRRLSATLVQALA